MSSTDETDQSPKIEQSNQLVADKRPDKIRPLRPKEQAFIAAYATPSSSTFGNATQSYLQAVSPDVGYDSARVQGSMYLTRPAIAESIIDILNQADLGIKVRADSLKRIVSHRDIGKSTSRVRHTDDETVTTTESGPAYRDVLKSIDLLNKIDGTYEKNRAAADVASTEYKQLVRRFFSTMEQRPRRARGGGGRGSPRVSNVSLLPKADKISVPGGQSLLPSADEKSVGGGIIDNSTKESSND